MGHILLKYPTMPGVKYAPYDATGSRLRRRTAPKVFSPVKKHRTQQTTYCVNRNYDIIGVSWKLEPPDSEDMSRQRKEIDTSTYTGKFALRLRELREKRGLSVDELAEKTGLSKRTLFSWEAATYSPSIEQLPTIADSLGVSIAVLMPKK